MPEAAAALQSSDKLDILHQRDRGEPIHGDEDGTTDEQTLIPVRQPEPPHAPGDAGLEHAGLPGGAVEMKAKTPADDIVGRAIDRAKGVEPLLGHATVRVHEPQPRASRASGTGVQLQGRVPARTRPTSRRDG